MFFKVALKVYKIIGLLCKKICTQELSKIAQSGHTAYCADYSWLLNFLVNQQATF